YETHSRESAKFEAHHDYIDIQYITSGEEIIEYHHATDLTPEAPYNPEKDCIFYPAEATPSHQIRLVPGVFCIFFPNELHMPGLHPMPEKPSTVKKVVVKVKMDF
ncbi:YhcH/YjgK/YiaL family protein, partial [bacterium]|nr:YhcH/YjgK/YiaL family protein [bacterium]